MSLTYASLHDPASQPSQIPPDTDGDGHDPLHDDDDDGIQQLSLLHNKQKLKEDDSQQALTRMASDVNHLNPTNASDTSTTPGVSKYPQISATANLTAAAIGAGLLSFAFAVRQQGIIMTIVLTICLGILNAYSLYTLARFTDQHLSSLKLHSYEEVVSHVLGPRWCTISCLLILVGGIGSLAGYMIIIVDISQPVFLYYCADASLGCRFITARATIVLLFGICIAMPLSMSQRIHSLWLASILAIVTVGVVFFLVLVRGIQHVSHHGTPDTHLPTFRLTPLQDISLLLGLPIIMFSLSNQTQLIPVYCDLPNQSISPSSSPSRARARSSHPSRSIMLPVILATSICVIVYLIMGILGYAQFGINVKGNILSNYGPTDTFANVTKLLMAIHIALIYPLALFPTRKVLDYYYYSHLQAQAIAHPDPHPDIRHPHIPTSNEWSRITMAQSISIIAITSLFAIIVPQVQIMFGLIGAITGAPLMFIMPGLMCISQPKQSHYHTGWGLMLLGILLFIGTTVSVMYEIISPSTIKA